MNLILLRQKLRATGYSSRLEEGWIRTFQPVERIKKESSQKHGIPPYTVFMDPSLEDMTVQYPISVDEITKIYGVGEGKAKKYGKEFADYIKTYVEDKISNVLRIWY